MIVKIRPPPPPYVIKCYILVDPLSLCCHILQPLLDQTDVKKNVIYKEEEEEEEDQLGFGKWILHNP